MTTIRRGRRTIGAAASVLVAALLAAPVALADDAGTPPALTGTPTAPVVPAEPAGDPTALETTTDPTTAITTTAPATSTTTTSSVPPTPAPTPTIFATAPTPFGSLVVLRVGSTGWAVQDLQSRLLVVGRASGTVDGRYDSGVVAALASFLRGSGLTGDGTTLTAEARLVLRARSASATVLAATASGASVKELQLRLRARSLWVSSISGTWSAALSSSVLTLQRQQNLPQSGVVDLRTWSRLVALTHAPGTFDTHRFTAGLRPLMPTLGSLDARCRTGRVLCVDKATRTLTWVVDGTPSTVMWARFGRPGLETREGTFSVLRKYEYVVSNLYFTPMPFSMFFSGGQAVHYSSNFARLGYESASHGCVNIGDYDQIKALFAKVRVGDKVVVRH